MSRPSHPMPHRTSATAAILLLATLLGLGLATSLGRELRAHAAPQAPPASSRLVAVLEGVMAVNVTPAERDRFKAWVAGGATREGFAQVAPVVANNCASCHDRGGQFPRITSFEDLRPMALEPAPAGLGALITPRVWHLFACPLLFLVAVAAYLRRVDGRWLGLAATSATAVTVDVAQWTWRQGGTGHARAAWVAAAALALCMAAVAGRVLTALWGQPSARKAP